MTFINGQPNVESTLQNQTINIRGFSTWRCGLRSHQRSLLFRTDACFRKYAPCFPSMIQNGSRIEMTGSSSVEVKFNSLIKLFRPVLDQNSNIQKKQTIGGGRVWGWGGTNVLCWFCCVPVCKTCCKGIWDVRIFCWALSLLGGHRFCWFPDKNVYLERTKHKHHTKSYDA